MEGNARKTAKPLNQACFMKITLFCVYLEKRDNMKHLVLTSVLALALCSCGTSNRVISVDHGGDDPINIGYGTTTRDETTNAVSTLKVDDKTSFTDIYDYIEGKIPGVMVVGNKFRVRGTRTISGDGYALVLVDGMEVNDLTGLTPDMVESIDVLKDAASSSIYGVRGANGVILVTTRKR